MEHCPCTLRNFLDQKDFSFSEIQISEIACQVLNGLSFLHKARVVHNNLRAESLLLTPDKTIRICDFSCAEQIPEGRDGIEIDRSVHPRGAVKKTWFLLCNLLKNNFQQKKKLHFAAPERSASKTYDALSDIWSFGVLLIELTQGHPPLKNEPPLKVMMMVGTGTYSPLEVLDNKGTFGEELTLVLAQCLQFDPSKRPTAQQLLSHPFVSSGKDSNNLKSLEPEQIGFFSLSHFP